MVNVDVVVSSLISQAPLVAVVILYNKIKGVESRVAEIEKAVKSLEARLDSLETRVSNIELRLESFAQYQETLLNFLTAKGVVKRAS